MSCYFLESTAFAKLFVQEPGTDALIRLMEAVEDNRKLIAACAPLEVYAAIRKRERAGDISRDGGRDRGRGKPPACREHLQEGSSHRRS